MLIKRASVLRLVAISLLTLQLVYQERPLVATLLPVMSCFLRYNDKHYRDRNGRQSTAKQNVLQQISTWVYRGLWHWTDDIIVMKILLVFLLVLVFRSIVLFTFGYIVITADNNARLSLCKNSSNIFQCLCPKDRVNKWTIAHVRLWLLYSLASIHKPKTTLIIVTRAILVLVSVTLIEMSLHWTRGAAVIADTLCNPSYIQSPIRWSVSLTSLVGPVFSYYVL